MPLFIKIFYIIRRNIENINQCGKAENLTLERLYDNLKTCICSLRNYLDYYNLRHYRMEIRSMERIKTLETRNLCESAQNGGCGECQTSCQSACKTSCGVANQSCENTEE